MCAAGITAHVSESLRSSDVLWPAMERALAGRVATAGFDEEPGSSLELPTLTSRGSCPWLFLECDFGYAPHRQICAEGGESRVTGTRFPVLLIFADASEAHEVANAAGCLCAWLSAPGGRFEASRPLLVAHGAKPSSLGRDGAIAALATGLVCHGLGVVEVRGAREAAEYVAQCASAVAESRKRRMPSRFKVAGVRCQTLRDPSEKLRISWVSQLMQVPGVSEEIAKIVAERYQSPGALLAAVASAVAEAGDASRAVTAAAEAFIAEMEYPIRGRKGTRRVGPIVSRRLFTLFHPTEPPDLVLA